MIRPLNHDVFLCVFVSVCVFVPLPCNCFQGFSLRSHGQFPGLSLVFFCRVGQVQSCDRCRGPQRSHEVTRGHQRSLEVSGTRNPKMSIEVPGGIGATIRTGLEVHWSPVCGIVYHQMFGLSSYQLNLGVKTWGNLTPFSDQVL